MTKLFRNSSPGALTLKQAAEQAKKQLIARGRQMRQARELAAQGRGSDTEVAHVARGEYVIPEAMQTPEVRAVLRRAAAAYGVPLEMLSVGNAMNRINPNTCAPEFGVMDWISGLFQGKSQTPESSAAPVGQAPLCRLPDGSLVPYRELPGGYAMVDGGGGGIGQHGLAQEIAKASDANVPKPGGRCRRRAEWSVDVGCVQGTTRCDRWS